MSTVYARSTMSTVLTVSIVSTVSAVSAVYSVVLPPSLMVFFLFNLRSPWTWDTFHCCQQSHNKIYQSKKIWLFSKRKRRSLAKLATRTILPQDALLLNFQLTSSKTFNWHDKHFFFFKDFSPLCWRNPKNFLMLCSLHSTDTKNFSFLCELAAKLAKPN